jgi:alpha-D-ribose 1-methylphosphonate 5-triphosphate synthase subunit PhnH
MLGLDTPWTSDGQRQVFRLLLEAWARPGTIADLGPWCGNGRARLAVLAALSDAATTLADPHGLLADGDRSRLGSIPAEIGEAAFVIAEAVRPPGDLAPARGTLLNPERGATLVLDCQAVGEGSAIRLTGPGIDGSHELHLLGIDPAWWTARRSWCASPLGVELVLCDARRIACIPRSSHLES